MEVKLNPGERIDDLQINGLKIIQTVKYYCFTSDAVILANFARVTPRSRVVDLGTGGGVIAILLVGKYGAGTVTGIEIQERLADMASRSVILNGLEDKIHILLSPMQDAHTVLGLHKADIAVCNPPYTRLGDGGKNLDPHIAMCRHETGIDLKGVCQTAARLLKFGGRLYMVHQSERLAEIMVELAKADLAPKRLRFVCGRVGKPPALVLIEALSGGKAGLKIEPPLELYDKDGEETPELTAIYGRQKN
ncbi:MAG: methyltransferase [Clostridiales bacterium]|nr:methyltransferase [Clostridiales bacterium]